MKRHIAVLAFAALLHLSGYYIVLQRIEPFQYFFYLISWWSYIIFIETVLVIRTTKFLTLNKNLPFLVIISSAFWCIFELINLRIENWFYINLPANLYQRWAGYLLAYGSVIPAICGTKELIYNLLGEIRVRPRSCPRYPRYTIPAGFASLLATLVFPRYCFPLVWIFLFLMLDGYNYRKGYFSFVKDWEGGSAKHLVATVFSGLVCGILWEMWNFWTISKWIYTVPFFENLKIFEMPVPGYLGFPVFAIETVALANALQGIKVYEKYPLRVAAIGLFLSFFTFSMIDRHTVFSYASDIRKLSFIEEGKRHILRAEGAQTSYGINARLLDNKENEALSLIHLKGLGYDNYTKLASYGITSIRDLSQSNEKIVSAILGEPNLRRTRVYLKAAQEYTERKQ